MNQELLRRTYDFLIARIPEDNETALQFIPKEYSESALGWSIEALLDYYERN